MGFTGTPTEIAFKEKLNRVLALNEIEGHSPYELNWAGTDNSGWSFGIPQYDLSVANTDNTNLFKEILFNATDGAGNYIIDDGDPLIPRGTLGNIQDSKVNDLLNKTKIKGGQGLSAADQALIDTALSSAYGKSAIDAEYDSTLDKLINQANRVIGLTSGADQQFLESDIGKLFLCDFANQYGITAGGYLEQFVQGGIVYGITKQGDLGVDDLLNFYFRTGFSKENPTVPVRRFAHIAAEAGYTPADLDEAKGVLSAYTFHIIPNEQSIANSNGGALDLFRTTVIDPAKSTVLTYYGLSGQIDGEVLVGIVGQTHKDELQGTDQNDLLFGEDGDDILKGGLGDDVLHGGKGDDTYRFSPGDGNDILVDEDGKGRIFIGDKELRDATHQQGDPDNVYKTLDGHTLTLSGDTLTIAVKDHGGTLTIQEFTDHPDRLGLKLNQDTPAYNVSSVFQAVFDYVGKRALGLLEYVIPTVHAAPNVVNGTGGSTPIPGTSGDDTIVGASAPGGEYLHESVLAGDGNDVVYADAVVDVQAVVNANNAESQQGIPPGLWNEVYAGGGEDLVVGGIARDWLEGGVGHDVLVGGDGDDSIHGDSGPESVEDGNDIVYAGPGDDEVWGGGGEDLVFAGSGDDEVIGHSGRDTLFGEAGNDMLAGDSIDDTALGQPYDDYLDGGAGDDELRGMAGADTLFGGTENDLLVGDDAALPVALHGNDYLDGEEGDDTLIGQGGADELFGGAGNDQLTGDSELLPLEAHGNDYLDGEDGDDLLIAGGGDDELFGGTGRDELQGGEGDDYLDGEEGDDRLFGGEGADVLSGGAGIDSLSGDAGDDYLDGGDGDDHSIFGGGLVGGAGNDTLFGEAGRDELQGGDGDDSLSGGTEDDLLFGGAGDDQILGDTGADELQGGEGQDTLDGGEGADLLFGEAGNDELTGGTGDDALYGEAGDDTYVIDRGDGYDAIYESLGFDTLRFGPGVLPEHVTLYRTEDDLRVVLDNGPQQIFIDGFFSASYDHRIEQFVFDNGNGAVWTLDDINARISAGSANAMTGTSGDDTFSVDHGGDTVSEAPAGGTDTIESWASYTLPENVENLTLTGPLPISGTGNVLDNVLRGNAADNYLDGREGYDTAYGGGGDDIYKNIEAVIENPGEGIDTWVSRNGGVLPANVENLTMDDSSGIHSIFNVSAIGNALDNTLTSGGEGVSGDVLDGREGADTMIASGSDSPIFVVDNVGDKVIASRSGGSNDKVISSVSYQLGQYVENLTLTGSDPISGTGNDLSNIIDGSSNAAANVLSGGKGDDTYTIGWGDMVIETAGEGNDTVQIATSVADNGRTYTLDDLNIANVEVFGLTGTGANITLVGNAQSNTLKANTTYSTTLVGGAGDDSLFGGNGNDRLGGGAGADSLYGGGGWGSDTYVVDDVGDRIYDYDTGTDTVVSSVSYALSANLEKLVLDGTEGIGGTGNNLHNTLDGARNPAANVLAGGAGNDLYLIGAGDSIVEDLNGGIDEVWSDVSISALGANIENAMLIGAAGGLNATGNELDNRIQGDFGDNALSGGAGNDTLIGGGGNDTIAGGAGNDTLDGSEGEDLLDGGSGDDAYLWGWASGKDTIDSRDGGVGKRDVVQVSESSVNVTVAQNGDDLVLNLVGTEDQLTIRHYFAGTNPTAIEEFHFSDGVIWTASDIGAKFIRGTSGNDTLVGTAGNEHLAGLAGDDTLSGGPGHDSLRGDDGTDILYGEAGIDSLEGGAGADLLDGGLGGDILLGGTGDDTYLIDDAADVVIENANEGVDTVKSAVTYTLAANVENLILTGTATLSGTGNALDNALTGNGAKNTLNGDGGNDLLDGGGNADTLTGGAGNDTLNGGAGADKLAGGVGDDTYVVDSRSDVVTEYLNEGVDSVQSKISYTLGANVENLTLTGTGVINGTGNALNNVIYGNSANNTLTAGSGDDLVNGGSGAGADTLNGDAGNDVLEGMDGGDTLKDSGGNNLFNGGTGSDALTGNSGNELFIGAAGNDTITTGTGADLIAFNRGDGQDVVNASTGADNTLSLGGGIRYTDLSFSKSANDLVLGLGSAEQITLKDWYATSVNNKSVLNLQMIAEAMADFDSTSSDPLRNNKVEMFNFGGLAERFDQARAADPTLTNWSLTNALLDFHLSGSDTEALGGDLAYQYGKTGTLAGLGVTSVQSVLSDTQFATAPQTLQPLATLQEGMVKLG